MYICVQKRNARGEKGMVPPPKLRRVGYSSLYPPQNCWHLAGMSSSQLLTQNCATVYVHTFIYT